MTLSPMFWGKGWSDQASRNRAIVHDRRCGFTLRAVAARYDLTVERIRQILAAYERECSRRIAQQIRVARVMSDFETIDAAGEILDSMKIARVLKTKAAAADACAWLSDLAVSPPHAACLISSSPNPWKRRFSRH